MKILHIFRSQPDDLVRSFVRGMSQGENGKETPLYQGTLDYNQLVKDIFESDKVICWW